MSARSMRIESRCQHCRLTLPSAGGASEVSPARKRRVTKAKRQSAVGAPLRPSAQPPPPKWHAIELLLFISFSFVCPMQMTASLGGRLSATWMAWNSNLIEASLIRGRRGCFCTAPVKNVHNSRIIFLVSERIPIWREAPALRVVNQLRSRN